MKKHRIFKREKDMEQTEKEVIQEITDWRLGIIFARPLIMIPKESIMGIRRLGKIDYLRKFGWLQRRISTKRS